MDVYNIYNSLNIKYNNLLYNIILNNLIFNESWILLLNKKLI